MMRRFLLVLVLLLLAAQAVPALAINSPLPDELLRGQAAITGSLNVPGVSTARLEFSYADNPTDTWFLIQTFSQPMVDTTLATWDTTSITDGKYVLRLRVTFEDSTSQEVTVPVQIGNDALPTATPEPTSTPEPESALLPTPFQLAASPTPTAVPRETPTALPPNPVSLEQGEVYRSLGRGALVILGLFTLAGLLIRARRY